MKGIRVKCIIMVEAMGTYTFVYTACPTTLQYSITRTYTVNHAWTTIITKGKGNLLTHYQIHVVNNNQRVWGQLGRPVEKDSTVKLGSTHLPSCRDQIR